ncbi:MAG: flagellin [Chlamydiales bacterium]|jgi:flagellin|nr:flagellin [Chlamydiales bacterium]
MIIANNATYKTFITNYGRQSNALQTSMNRLSSGSSIVSPGDAPADLGISERLRAQIRGGQEAAKVIQNGINMLQTTDSWVQQVNDMLNRMKELATGSVDSSKSQGDRANLDKEFQQLKQEIARISDSAKSQGLQITGKTAIATWDTVSKQIMTTQPDGSDLRTMPLVLRDGNTASDGRNYAFEQTTGTVGEFLFVNDGKEMFYMAQQTVAADGITQFQSLMKLNIETNTLSSVDLAAAAASLNSNEQARIVRDEEGRVWVSDPSGTTFSLKLLDTESMTLDAGGAANTNWGGGVTMAAGCSNFRVYDDYVYFIEQDTSSRYNVVKQNLYTPADRTTLVADLETNYDFVVGDKIAFSADGQYLAFASNTTGGALADGQLQIVNTQTSKFKTFNAGTQLSSVAALDFDANNKLYWTDTSDTGNDQNTVRRLSILPGAEPNFSAVETIRHGTPGTLGAPTAATAGSVGFGLNTQSLSSATTYTFQAGPDAGMEIEVSSADVRLSQLKLAADNVSTIKDARLALEHIEYAIEKVTDQRARIGAQVSRMMFTLEGNNEYVNNASQAESRIRSVDMAAESAKLANQQILKQASISVIGQSNQDNQSVLRLLQ